MLRLSSAVLFLFTTLALPACVFNHPEPAAGPIPRDVIVVVGEGEVLGKPDVARLQLGVEARARDAATAVSAINEKSARMIEVLKQMGVRPEDLQTRDFNIHSEQMEGEPMPLEEPAVVTIEARVLGAQPQLWQVDGRYRAIVVPTGGREVFEWAPVLTLPLGSGDHDLRARIASHEGVDLIRATPRRSSDADYVSVLSELGLKVSAAEAPVTRSDALASLSSGVFLELAGRFQRRIEGDQAPRPLTGVACAGLDPLGAVAPAPPLVERFDRARRALRAERGSHPYSFGTPPLVAENALCPARRAMWRADVPPGQRNNVAIRLASAFRLAGYNPNQSLALLRQWGARQVRPLPAQEIEAVVHSAYVRPYAYGYGCRDAVIRAFCPYAGRFEDCAARPTRPRRSERNDQSAADTSPLARCGYDP